MAIVAVTISELCSVVSVRVHDEDVGSVIHPGGKYDPFPVGRPTRYEIRNILIGQLF